MSTINTKLFATFVLMGGALVAQAEEATQSHKVESIMVRHIGSDGTDYHDATRPDQARIDLDNFHVTTTTGLDTKEDVDKALLLFHSEENKEQPRSNLCPDINLNRDNASWTLTYTIKNVSKDVVAVQSISATLYGLKESVQTSTSETGEETTSRVFNTIVESAKASATLSYTYGNSVNNITSKGGEITGTGENGTSAGGMSFELLNDGFLLKENESLTFSMIISADYVSSEITDSLYVGIDSISFNGYYIPANPPSGSVPEPTSATLSLLALAGLAARRRRK